MENYLREWPADEDPADHPGVVNLDYKANPNEFYELLAPIVERVTGSEYELVEYDSGGDSFLYEFRRKEAR